MRTLAGFLMLCLSGMASDWPRFLGPARNAVSPEAIAPASPEKFQPAARAQLIDGTVRAYPTLSNGVLYVRNESTLIAVQVGNAR